MPLTSDLSLSASKFDSKAISSGTKEFNDGLIKIMNGVPRWYEVGAAKYRQMRANGETPLPMPIILDSGKNIKIASREKGREIPCRVFTPESGKPKGVYYHIHGGGWVLQTEEAQDPMLKYFADHAQLTVVSIGYRLAPEHPYPAPNEDCYDIGEYLVDNAEEKFGAQLMFMGGESAGGHLSAVTCLHLLKTRPKFAFKGVVLNYGIYDVSGLMPQAYNFDMPLVLDFPTMTAFIEAYLPGKSEKEKRDPELSPFFADLTKMKCPPALFTVGTLDLLMDDSIMMSTKWSMSGAESVLKVYPGKLSENVKIENYH